MNKKIVILSMFWGGIIGAYVPVIFGVSAFSLISVFGGFIGGLLAVWLSFKWLN